MQILRSSVIAAALVAVSAFSAAARDLTIGYQSPKGDNVDLGVVAMEEKLKELSGGKMSFKTFPNAQLGDFKAMVAQVQANELDMVITGYPDMSYIIPELNLSAAPYAISNFAHFERVFNGEYGRRMNSMIEKQGVKILDVWYFGTRHMTSNKPINSIADMKGLRLRTPNVPFLIEFAKNVGASPAPVAFQEVYLALQTNQVDAQENPLPTIKAMKFYEVQSHVALTGHFIATTAINIGLDVWNNLSKQERSWLVAAIKHGGDVSDALNYKDESKLVAEFEKLGLSFTRPDTAPFREAMKPYYDKLDAEFGKGSVASIINQ